jgi:hypothetical protein
MKKLLSLAALVSLAATSNLSTMALLLVYDSDVTPYANLSSADQAAAIPACKIIQNYRQHPKQRPTAQDTKELKSALAKISGRMSGNAHHARLFARRLSSAGNIPTADSQRVTNALVELCPESASVKEVPMKRKNKHK